MNRSITWQQTGGRTHRVTITEDVEVSAFHYALMNFARTTAWEYTRFNAMQALAQQNVAVGYTTPLSAVAAQAGNSAGLGLLGNLFGGYL